MPRAICCQGGTLRALISALVVIQCALILLYWDATRTSSTSNTNSNGGGGGGKPLHLQAKASNEHLHAQAESDSIPEVAAKHFRENYESDTTATPTVDEKGGRLGKPEKAAAGSDRQYNTLGEHQNVEAGNGKLISPETELLLFKPPTRRKYPQLSKQSEQIQTPNDEPIIVVQLNKGQISTNISIEQLGKPSKDSKPKDVVASPDTKLIFQDAQKGKRPHQPNNTPQSGNITGTEQTVNISKDPLSNPSNGYKQYGVHRLRQYQPKSGSHRSWFTPTYLMQRGAAIVLKPTLSPLPPKSQNGTAEMEAASTKQQVQAVGSSEQTDLRQGSRSTEQAVSNATSTTSKEEIPQEQQQLVTTTLSNEPPSTVSSTHNPWLAAHLQRKKSIYPTYETPMPIDPYSVNSSSKVLYTTGTHEEFHSLTPTLPQVFHLPHGSDVLHKYFVKNGAENCYKEGTAIAAGELKEEEEPARHDGCLCKRGWHGRHCSIPEGVFSSTGARFVDSLKPRNVSRRVISALAFNVEFELLEARLSELDDVVDVFIILESNYTNYGDPKPLLLLQKFRDGYLKQFHHKIIYLFRGRIPQGGREDGWIVDQHMRMYIGQEGMSRIFNSTPDDIFLYTDADEIPNREAILFLRIHDGYSEPIGVALRWSVFGFFWKQFEATRVVIGCTVGMFRYVFNNDAYQLRSTDYQSQASSKLHAYISSGAFIYDWYMGDNGALAGWHCSWCLPPERIRIKLTSAINADFPRWGDFPEKLELPYLRTLIKTGTWFDDKSRFGMLVNWESEDMFAPKYVLSNYDRYKYLLDLDQT